jgi:integrase
MTDGDPHNRTTRIRNTIQNLEQSEKVSEHNLQVVKDFKQYLEAQGLSKDRISRYLYSLKRIAEEVEWKLDEPSKNRIIQLVRDIHQSEYWEDEISDGTQSEYKKLIRKLYNDYLSSKREDVDGEDLTDFFTVAVSKNYADPNELPRPKQVAEIVRNCPRPRDSGFCMLLWSSAARIGAVLGLKWKDVRFHEDIATANFRDTKTGDDRKVPIASAFPYLKRHKERDILGSRPEAFVFRRVGSTEPENQLSYNGARGIIDRAVERADLTEQIKTNPHAFRKGRISDLARKGFSEAQISKISGHIIGSEDIRVYCRLASEDVTSSIREEAGLEPKNQELEKDPLRPKKCPNRSCDQLNKWENEHCTNCGEVLETGELFKEVKTKETKQEIRKNIVDKETNWDDEEVSEKAKELVEENL